MRGETSASASPGRRRSTGKISASKAPRSGTTSSIRGGARSHVDELKLDRSVDRDLVGDRAPPRIELVVPERGAFDAEIFPVDRRRPGEAEALVSPRILQQRMRGETSASASP